MPVTSTFPPLQYARFHFEVMVNAKLKLPGYAGSMLRGAFGYAFRRLSCMTRQKTCNNCPLISTCPYPLVFENSKGPMDTNLYAIEPPAPGARLLEEGGSFNFAMVLFNEALHQLPLILLAWQHALESGLGKDHIPAKLVAVYREGIAEPIYRPGEPIGQIQMQPQVVPASPNEVILDFKTPVCLKQYGRYVRKTTFTPYPLVMALARRLSMLGNGHGHASIDAIDFKRVAANALSLEWSEDFHWCEWERYSNRQQQTMPLGGLLGQLSLKGDLDQLWPMLYVGQWTHLGRHASFGLGHYQIS
tara:strand:- start:1604 stop:2512 length:909 start_codon:yes stop_codon:yes gene_type:complete